MSALRMIAGGSAAETDLQVKPTKIEAMDGYRVQPLTVRIPEACRISGIGRSKLYELIKAREIATTKVGRITLVPMESLKEFLGISGNRPC